MALANICSRRRSGECDGAGCDPKTPMIQLGVGVQPCPIVRELITMVAKADDMGLLPNEREGWGTSAIGGEGW